MLNQVKTVVVNKSRTPFKLAYGRGQTLVFTPGKERVLDFDLTSTLDRTAKQTLQTAVNRGTLTVTTKVIADATMITIDGGSINLSPYVQEAPKLITTTVKKKAESEKAITVIPEEDTYIGGKSGGIANKSEERFKAAFGVSTESQMDSLVENITVPANGKLEKTAAVVPLKKINTKAEDTVSVFKSEVADKEAAEEEKKDTNVDLAEQLEITKYLGEKDYSIVYAWLEEHYGDLFPKKLTKATVRKCRTYDELIEAILRVDTSFD